MRFSAPTIIFAGCLVSSLSCYAADTSSLEGKVLVGYQGWFRCPDQNASPAFWNHWFKFGQSADQTQNPANRRWVVDQYPDTSEMDRSSLCPISGTTNGGKPLYLFTSLAPATELTHFRWMQQYDIDGVLLQRFVNRLPQEYAEHDQVLKNVMEAAQQYDRVFAIEYDVTDAHGDVLAALQQDWTHLTRDLHVTERPGYQMDRGRPVVSIWGLGFGDNRHISDPEEASRIISWFKSQGVSVMGGVPGYWTVGQHDASPDPRWATVYADLDIIQPWTVGRYQNAAQARAWGQQKIPQDIGAVNPSRQRYMPVIFPGFSWHATHPSAPLNQTPRMGGAFLVEQARAARAAGATMIKIAMFDEVNEGTALLKTAETTADVPTDGDWLTMDADGEPLSNDDSLRAAKEVARLFHDN